jgi:HAD superfamily hydrolase (TIGR01490 family)
MRLALFDLDRTLIDVNSGRLWLASEWREGRLGWRSALWASYRLALYSLGREAGLAEAVSAAVQTLEGTDEAEFDRRIRAWFDREVYPRARAGALARHRQAGDTLILATSGTSYAARAAVDAWNLDGAVATTLEVADGRLTGRITQSCVGAAKAEAVQQWADHNRHDLQQAVFYTDSATDLELLLRVGQPVAVHPDRALGRIAADRGWSVEWW